MYTPRTTEKIGGFSWKTWEVSALVTPRFTFGHCFQTEAYLEEYVRFGGKMLKDLEQCSNLNWSKGRWKIWKMCWQIWTFNTKEEIIEWVHDIREVYFCSEEHSNN